MNIENYHLLAFTQDLNKVLALIVAFVSQAFGGSSKSPARKTKTE